MDIEKAKKLLNGIDIKFFLNGTIEQSNYIVDKADEVNKAIETVLNELEKKDTVSKKQYNHLKKSLKGQIKKKDKVIDLMAKKMAFEGAGRKLFSCDFRIETGKCDENGCESCIKKYYKKKAEEK